MRKNRKLRISMVFVVTVCLVLLTFAAITVIFDRLTQDTVGLSQEPGHKYEYHFAFIADDLRDTSWENIYEGAREMGEELDIYVERTGENLSNTYTKQQLLEITILQGVDGIIVQGDESEETKVLIDRAETGGIPVVNFLVDSNSSMRQSFIGIGSYNLGREYGRQVIRISTKATKRVVILMDKNSEGSDQSIIYTGIMETIMNEGNHLDIELETMLIDNLSAFSAEEDIRDLFLQEELPDIIICMNETNTVSACQAVIDYNKVGEVNIIGYHRSDTILTSIEREVIAATISVDSNTMGQQCTYLLSEYLEQGYVSDYIAMDAVSITKANVNEYRTGEKQNEEE